MEIVGAPGEVVTLYEAVAGRRPIVANDMASLFAAIATSEPVPLERICPQVPEAFAAVVMRSLRKSPGDRFQLASGDIVPIGQIQTGGNALMFGLSFILEPAKDLAPH